MLFFRIVDCRWQEGLSIFFPVFWGIIDCRLQEENNWQKIDYFGNWHNRRSGPKLPKISEPFFMISKFSDTTSEPSLTWVEDGEYTYASK